MPKREDERLLNMTGRHPAACTCQDCTDRFLKSKKMKPQRAKPQLARQASAERVAKHPADCTCTSCVLLGTLENLPQVDRGPGGFLKRLFRKR